MPQAWTARSCAGPTWKVQLGWTRSYRLEVTFLSIQADFLKADKLQVRHHSFCLQTHVGEFEQSVTFYWNAVCLAECC